MKYSELPTKADRISFLKEKLSSDPRWAVKGLLRIYEYQTEEEKIVQATTEHNGVGFSGVDGEILTSFADQIVRGRTLSAKQINLVFKKMPKYARQLEGIANKKQETA